MRVLILCIIFVLLLGCVEQPTTKIKTFEECVNAGYPVLESYPRQCKTPDGRTFVSGTDFLEVNHNVSCSIDADCKLVNKKLGFSCCWAGACEGINYSQDKWVAMNKKWYDGVQKRYCPNQSECGPAPMCAVKAINTNYTASCINKQCKKVPITANISVNITVPEANITANLTMPNITINETTNETANVTGNGIPKTENLTGILFGDGAYLLVLEDISVSDSCALMSVNFAANQSEITKLKGCPGKDVNWVSSEGRIFRIKVIKTAAGYTYAEKWASVIIFG